MMLKYSQLHHDEAHFIMVGVAKNFLKVNKVIANKYNLGGLMLEVRKPKSELILDDGEEEEEKIKTYKRTFYDFSFTEHGFRSFL